MSSRLSLATWLMWLALLFTAVDYWLVWNRLPARMASHFDANWHANGWATREASLEFALLVLLALLAVFTVAIFAMSRGARTPPLMPWVMLVFAYGVLILFCTVNHWVLRYNLGERTKGPFQAQTLQLRQSRGESLVLNPES